MENIDAKSGAECALKCAEKDGCRSANFRRLQSCGEIKNCELLTKVYSQTPSGHLKRDEEYDYYILLDCNGVSIYQIQAYFHLHLRLVDIWRIREGEMSKVL